MSTRAAETRSAKPAATDWNRPAKPASTTVEHNDRPCHENKITGGWVFPPDLSHELRYTSLPILPVLITTLNNAHTLATDRLHAAQAVAAGDIFTVGGQTLRRSRTTHATVGKTWAEDPSTGKRRDLSLEEHQAFWTLAAVNVLRHTGIR